MLLVAPPANVPQDTPVVSGPSCPTRRDGPNRAAADFSCNPLRMCLTLRLSSARDRRARPKVEERKSMSKNLIEGLESRRLLSTSLSGGIVSVNGGSGADDVAISVSGSNLVVKENGATKTFALSGVKQIKVSGNAGNDIVALAANVTVRALLDGGLGDDKLTGGTASDTLQGGD